MVRKKSGRLFSYKYKHFASPGEHHLSVLFFPFTHLKAQFIDSSFPLSQLTFNRLPGRVVNSCFEVLGATGQGGRWGGVISLGLLQHWGRVCLVHISFQSRTKLKRKNQRSQGLAVSTARPHSIRWKVHSDNELSGKA